MTPSPLPAQLVVLAKQPLAGRAKTRLSPALHPEQAANVARACLLDTLAAVAATPVLRRTVVLDGSAYGWLPGGLDVLPQVRGGLGERLAAGLSDTYARCPVPMLLIGMDTPQVTPALLTRCLHDLLAAGTDAVLGPADDGGWWALGLREPVPDLFTGVPMSSARTGPAQAERLTALGLAFTWLPQLRDIDLVEDLTAVAADMPADSRLAAVVADLVTDLCMPA